MGREIFTPLGDNDKSLNLITLPGGLTVFYRKLLPEQNVCKMYVVHDTAKAGRLFF
jgi:hypothetical protein